MISPPAALLPVSSIAFFYSTTQIYLLQYADAGLAGENEGRSVDMPFYTDTEHELKWRKAIFIAHRAKCSYDTGICDFFPYQSQMQQRRKAMFL